MNHRLAAARVAAVCCAALALLGTGCRLSGPRRHPGGGTSTIFEPVIRSTTTSVKAGSDGGDLVTLDPDTVTSDPSEIDIDLPDGKKTAHRVSSTSRGPGNFTWIGKTDDAPAPNVVITVVNGQVAVHVQEQGGSVVGNTTGKGTGNRTTVPDDGSAGPNVAVHPPDGTPTVPPPPPPPAGTTTTIDLMIVFNSATAAIYGAAAVPAEAQNAIDRTNKALLDSKTNVQLRLVHVEQVPDQEIAANGGDNLSSLMRSQKVAQLRDQYGADLVQAWGTYPSVCGQGYQQVKGTMPSQYGFSVINAARKDKQCVGGVGVAHELGHNLAAGHDRAADHAEGKPGDAFAYVDIPHQFLDIMAYPSAQCSPPRCTRAWLYSNPDVLFRGYPAGRAGSEDDARNIREYGVAAAKYRPAKV
jgi:hypothetical protein